MSEPLALPPGEYRELVCGPDATDLFEQAGQWLVDFLSYEGMLAPGTSFLDIGCGCGRVARYLLDKRIKTYRGFDRHRGMVNWCSQEISKRDRRFSFDFFPLKSSCYEPWDNERGAFAVEDFHFPYPDAGFDTCLLASVFTHMPPNEVRHYMAELTRVMRSGGKIVLSVFFSPTGKLEFHDNRLNVFHDAREFYGDLARRPWDVRRVGHRFTPGESFAAQAASPEPFQPYEQVWHVLTRL
jgi:SAM-dependent methyltransferase